MTDNRGNDCRYRKYLHLRNSNNKFEIYDHREIEESVSKWLQQRPTTGNSDMAAKTGSTYISGIMADSTEISTANPGLLAMASSLKVSLSDCDNDR